MPPDADASRRVLIVDDNVTVHEDYRRVLTDRLTTAAPLEALEAALFDAPAAEHAEVFEVDSAYQGQEALTLVAGARTAGRPYALAFVDMRMPPGWNGLETVERLWQVDPELQIVICSAYSDHSWGDFRARLGLRDGLLFLKKPFESIEVLQCAHALTKKWHLAGRSRAYLADLESAVQARTTELQIANRRLEEEMCRRDKVEGELRLAHKLEAVGRLASGIAHELNTPVQFVSDSVNFVGEAVTDLAALIGTYQAVLGSRVAGAFPADALREVAEAEQAADVAYLLDEVPKALGRSQDGLGRIATIVRAMKDFAHPDGREMSAVDLNAGIRSTLAIARNEYKRFADVETDLGDLPRVICHGGEMNQALLNLIVNAAHAIHDVVKETGQRGCIAIRTVHEGDHVLITIRDTAAGIPPEIRDRIFDPFFTTKEVGKGTGQGLAITRSVIMDKHGGQLTFETEMGKGTTFFIRLRIDCSRHRSAEAAA